MGRLADLVDHCGGCEAVCFGIFSEVEPGRFAQTPLTAIEAAEPARAVKVTILSTMLAGDRSRGIGEWGFAALLEVDGQRLLIDTGERPETVLKNASELGIDLSDVTDLVITHSHGDHTAGLVTLRRELATECARIIPSSRAAGDLLSAARTERRGH